MSKNFTISELLKSDTANLHGFTEQYQPSSGIIKNLNLLIENILQPLRDAYGKPITINCGYRCPRTNQAVKGAATSQHLTGQAADITGGSIEANKVIFELAKKLPFDQEIWEQGGKWIHISYDPTRNRKQILYL